MRNTRVLRTCSQWSTAKPLPQLMERVISWEKKLRSTPLNLLPPYAQVAERQTVVRESPRRVFVLSEATTRDVPFSDHYVIKILWVLTDVSGGGAPRCEVCVYFSVRWLKATWLKSKLYGTFLAEWKKSVQSAQEILAAEFSPAS